MTTQGLEKLEVWRKAKDLAVQVYRRALPLFPVEEKWGMAQQLRRSVQSVPANLAEGYGRYYYQENIRFCYISRGSLEETLSHLRLAYDLGYLPDELYQSLIEAGNGVDRMINGYIGYLKRSKVGANEPGAPGLLREGKSDYFPEPIDLSDDSVLRSLFSSPDSE